MSKAGRLYYFACVFMWNVMSAFYLLYADERPATDHVVERRAQWAKQYMLLTNWLNEERFRPLDTQNVPISSSERIHNEAEQQCDNLYMQYRDTLLTAVVDAHKQFPQMDESLHLYSYYCQWLAKTLDEFDQLATGPDLRSTQYYKHYYPKADVFQDLISLLQAEHAAIDVGDPGTEILRDEIESTAEELVGNWRKAVFSSAEH